MRIAPIQIADRAKQVFLGITFLSSWLFILGSVAPSASAAGVSYSISPSTASVKPGDPIKMTVTMKTDTALAGGSLHLAYTNSSYDSFQTGGSAAVTFTDYHTDENDLLYICSNNNCDPGTYQIGTIIAIAGASGNAQINFTPKETIDSDLNLIGADGASGVYDITPSAQPAATTVKKGQQSTFSVPRDNGSGGTEPLQVTNETFIKQSNNAVAAAANGNTDFSDISTSTTFWTTKHIALIGIGSIVFLALLWIIVLRFIGRGPKGPYGSGPSGPQGPPPVIYTR